MGRTQTERILARFPKQRPPLPPEFAAIYAEHYKSNREGTTAASSLAQRVERWLHTQVAADLTRAGADLTAGARRTGEIATLEIGAGTLNQLQHEPTVGPYDVVEPFEALYADSPQRSRVRAIYASIDEVPPERRYDRVTSVATLEHICELPAVVARAALLLAPGGSFRASIPSEGTPIWALGWMLTTGLEFRLRRGLDYGVLMRHEHVNTATEIETVLRYCFRRLSCRVFGLSRGWSLYRFYECSDPDLDRCRAALPPPG